MSLKKKKLGGELHQLHTAAQKIWLQYAGKMVPFILSIFSCIISINVYPYLPQLGIGLLVWTAMAVLKFLSAERLECTYQGEEDILPSLNNYVRNQKKSYKKNKTEKKIQGSTKNISVVT